MYKEHLILKSTTYLGLIKHSKWLNLSSFHLSSALEMYDAEATTIIIVWLSIFQDTVKRTSIGR